MELQEMRKGNDVAAEERRYPKRFRMARLFGYPMFLRQEQLQGWSGRLPIYVRWCGDCERFSVTPSAGYGRMYCACCRASQRIMTWHRFRHKVLPTLLPSLMLPALVILAWQAWRRLHGIG